MRCTNPFIRYRRTEYKSASVLRSAGYDVSNSLFQAFLSDEMMYSCALWGPEEGGVRGDLEYGPSHNDLEAAQLRKIHHVLMKARVRPGDRLLEFGTGWGALAIEVRDFSCLWLCLCSAHIPGLMAGCKDIRCHCRYINLVLRAKIARRRADRSRWVIG